MARSSPASPPLRGPKRSPSSATGSASSAPQPRFASWGRLDPVIDARGRVVIPGINDAHVHIGARPAGRRPGRPSGRRAGSFAGRNPAACEGGRGKGAAGGWITVTSGAGSSTMSGRRAPRWMRWPPATRSCSPRGPDTEPSSTRPRYGGCRYATTTRSARRVLPRMPGTRVITGVAHEYAEYILRQRLSMMPDEQAQAKVLRDRRGGGRPGHYVNPADGDQPARRAARAHSRRRRPANPGPGDRLSDDGHHRLAWARERVGRGLDARDRVGRQIDLDGTPVERLMKAFYGKTLDLRLMNERPDRFTVEAGETTITFVTSEDTAGGRAPFYHFAFNIPENKIVKALEWQKARTPMLAIPRAEPGRGLPARGRRLPPLECALRLLPRSRRQRRRVHRPPRSEEWRHAARSAGRTSST